MFWKDKHWYRYLRALLLFPYFLHKRQKKIKISNDLRNHHSIAIPISYVNLRKSKYLSCRFPTTLPLTNSHHSNRAKWTIWNPIIQSNMNRYHPYGWVFFFFTSLCSYFSLAYNGIMVVLWPIHESVLSKTFTYLL